MRKGLCRGIFFYAWANRMIGPRSKRGLGGLVPDDRIQQIRPVELRIPTSERYWEKWERLSSEQIEQIGKQFLQRLWTKYNQSPHSLLFDTTNYYTYMATKTESELALRGHNKSGRHHLRQVGLGLLLDRESRCPCSTRPTLATSTIRSCFTVYWMKYLA